MADKKAKCTDCRHFKFKKDGRDLKELYICNAVVNVVIPKETIEVECDCQYYKRL